MHGVKAYMSLCQRHLQVGVKASRRLATCNKCPDSESGLATSELVDRLNRRKDLLGFSKAGLHIQASHIRTLLRRQARSWSGRLLVRPGPRAV